MKPASRDALVAIVLTCFVQNESCVGQKQRVYEYILASYVSDADNQLIRQIYRYMQIWERE